jgi:hypothetical protein
MQMHWLHKWLLIGGRNRVDIPTKVADTSFPPSNREVLAMPHGTAALHIESTRHVLKPFTVSDA